jgi:CubicO group peptidase (beta-lactamase class C family)
MKYMNESNYLRRLQSCALRVLFLAPVASISILAESAPNDASKPDFSNVRRFIQEQLVATSVPSMSVAVARNGTILWEEGFGWADRENRVPATEHTMYYTASVTKSFTDMAIMVLHERKKLDVDRPVNDYLGTAKLTSTAFNPADATIRRVATHTAGLTTFNPAPAHQHPAEEMIRRYGVLFWPPGERYDYSNFGPIILEEVIVRTSGESYADFMRNEVFWPLGMTRASIALPPSLEKYAAKRYNLVTGLKPAVTGGVYCSAHDLLLFGMFHLKEHLSSQKALLTDASIDAMQNETAGDHLTPVSVYTGTGRYSLGWWTENYHGFRSVLGQGGTDADQAWLRLIPSERTAVVVLCNAGHGGLPSTVVDKMLAAMLPSYADHPSQDTSRQPLAQDEKLPPSLFGEWKGIIRTYRGDVPLAFLVKESGDVHAKLGSQLETVVNNARFKDGGLRGRISGDLGVDDDTGPERYNLDFELYLRDGKLQGAAVTRGNAGLPFWTELRKLPATAGQP